jgi:hypothetical protein
MKLASITFLSLVLSPTGSIYLGFTTEGRLADVPIIPSLGVPNWSVIYINTAPSVFSSMCFMSRSYELPIMIMIIVI